MRSPTPAASGTRSPASVLLYAGLGVLAVKAVRVLAKPDDGGDVPYGPDEGPRAPDADEAESDKAVAG